MSSCSLCLSAETEEASRDAISSTLQTFVCTMACVDAFIRFTGFPPLSLCQFTLHRLVHWGLPVILCAGCVFAWQLMACLGNGEFS